MGKVFNLALGTSDVIYELESILVQTMPNKTEYTSGQEFDPTGMEILANYTDGASGIVSGYSWSPHVLDSSMTEVTITYSINGITKHTTVPVTVEDIIATAPTQYGTLTYTGNSQSPSWSNYDKTLMTIDSEPSEIDAGEYSSIFTLKENVKWTDGTKDPKTVTWVINKAAGFINLSSTSVTLSGPVGTSKNISYSASGIIGVSMSDNSIVSVGSGTSIISLTSKASGSCTITVSAAASANYTKPSNKTISVTVTVPSWRETKRYTTAGTYTYSPSYSAQKLGAIIVGGGVSGGGTSRYYKKGGDGGRSGRYAVVSDQSWTSSVSIVVGAKGSGSVDGGTSSAFGVTSANGSYVSGGSGVDNANGGSGSLTSISNPFGASVRVGSGGAGGGANGGNTSSSQYTGGSGFGYGGNGGRGGTDAVSLYPENGTDASYPGCGGGGGGAAYSTSSSFYSSGGAGTDGMVIIYEYK